MEQNAMTKGHGMRGPLGPVVLASLLLFCSMDIAPAQQEAAADIIIDPTADAVFDRAVADYESGDFSNAEERFEELASRDPVHQKTTAAYLMLGKTLRRRGKHALARKTLRDLLALFPRSGYTDDAHYSLARSYFDTKQWTRAVAELLWVVDYSDDRRLKKEAGKRAVVIIDRYLNGSDLEDLHAQGLGQEAAAVIAVKLAQAQARNGEAAAARATLEEFIRLYPDSPYHKQATELLGSLDKLSISGIRVAVIQPLSGSLAEEGTGVLQGIRYATKEYNRRAVQPVKLIVRDSESSIVTAVKVAQRVTQDDSIVAIIGELESDKTAAIAGLAASRDIPLIAPTATRSELASIGRSIFQANSDHARRAERLAEYAFEKLNLRTFAILAPADEYGKEMTDAFTGAVDRLGGNVMAQKWYYEGTKDVRRQLTAIRETGLRKMVADSLIVLGQAPVDSRVDSLWSEVMEKLYEDADRFTKKDSLGTDELTITTIDGVFLPIYPEDIAFIAPQLAVQNVETQLLGGNNWYDADVLRKNNDYINGVVFTLDVDASDENPEFIKFRNNFRHAMKTTPDRMTVYGYNAAKLLLSALERGAKTRQAISEALGKTRRLQVLGNRISFDEMSRANSEVILLKYRDGAIVKVTDL